MYDKFKKSFNMGQPDCLGEVSFTNRPADHLAIKVVPRNFNATVVLKIACQSLLRISPELKITIGHFLTYFPHLAEQIQFARPNLLYISNGETIDSL